MDARRHGEGGACDGEGEGSKSNFDARDETRGCQGRQGHGGGGTEGHHRRGAGAGATPCGKPQGTVAVGLTMDFLDYRGHRRAGDHDNDNENEKVFLNTNFHELNINYQHFKVLGGRFLVKS